MELIDENENNFIGNYEDDEIDYDVEHINSLEKKEYYHQKSKSIKNRFHIAY